MKLTALLFTALFGVLVGAHAAPLRFTIDSQSLPPLSEGAERGSTLQRLKQQAVREYLQRILGPRFERYDTLVTPEFAENYILDYRVLHQSRDMNQMEIEGRLDTSALKEWIRINETKAAGSETLKPALILSSNLPAFALDARNTAQTSTQTPFGQAVRNQMEDVFAKFNARLSTRDSSDLSVNRPPTHSVEVRALADFGGRHGLNSAVWIHLNSCRQCGMRLDVHLYNLSQNRQVLSISSDLALSVADLNNSQKLTRTITQTLKQFQKAFEQSISDGTLFAAEYALLVEDFTGYKNYRALDAALSQHDFILTATLSKASHRQAEFQILSTLQPKELYSRLDVAQFPGLTLKPVRIDSNRITVRHLQ